MYRINKISKSARKKMYNDQPGWGLLGVGTYIDGRSWIRNFKLVGLLVVRNPLKP